MRSQRKLSRLYQQNDWLEKDQVLFEQNFVLKHTLAGFPVVSISRYCKLHQDSLVEHAAVHVIFVHQNSVLPASYLGLHASCDNTGQAILSGFIADAG